MEKFKDFHGFKDHVAVMDLNLNVDDLAKALMEFVKMKNCREAFEAQEFVADLLEFLFFDKTQNKYFINKTGVSEQTLYRINGAWQAWQIRQNEVEELRRECERLQDKIKRITDPDTQDTYNFAQAFYRRVVKATDLQLPKELSHLKIDPSFVKAMFITAMGVFDFDNKKMWRGDFTDVFPKILEKPDEVVGDLKIDANHIHSSIP
ncbi:TPA: hypothetical protein NM870_003479 [Acinetobacter baumannii]|nr:hypothetical protein [Acinetobacter baumannii]